MLTPETVLQGRYRIIRSLGQGGMGTVYEAVDERLDSTVALKETLFTDERLRKQFEREARLLARMHHQALPRVSDHFSEGEGQFLIMQFIPGDDLAEKFAQRRSPFPTADVLVWADQLLDALDYLHTQEPPIVHRDIKPQNLKVTARGQVILLDFGLAKGHASEISRVTTSASIFGYTPNYAPLEQIQGLGTNARSDLYALAATLYNLVTGIKPPDALTRAAAMVNGQPDPLKPAHEVNGDIPHGLSTVLDRAMAQNRDQRYRDAAEMRRALQQGESETTTATSRSEANTVLFPSASPTVSPTDEGKRQTAAFTSAKPRQATIATGETTLLARPEKKRGAIWAVGAAAIVFLIAGVGVFYAYQKRKAADTVATPAASVEPSPAAVQHQPEGQVSGGEGSAVNSVSVGTNSVEADKQQVAADEKQTKKQEKSAKQIESAAKQAADRAANANRDRAASEEEFEMLHPTVPAAPNVDYPNQPNRIRPRRDGVVIRNLRDGSQLLVMPDGTRVLTRPDGTRQVITPGRRVNRRRVPPPPP